MAQLITRKSERNRSSSVGGLEAVNINQSDLKVLDYEIVEIFPGGFEKGIENIKSQNPQVYWQAKTCLDSNGMAGKQTKLPGEFCYKINFSEEAMIRNFTYNVKNVP